MEETHEYPLYTNRFLCLSEQNTKSREIPHKVAQLRQDGSCFLQVRRSGEVFSWGVSATPSVEEWKKIFAYYFPQVEYVMHPPVVIAANGHIRAANNSIYIDGHYIDNFSDYTDDSGNQVFCSILQVKLPYKIDKTPWLSTRQ